MGLRGRRIPAGEHRCELATLLTPEGPDHGPAYFEVLTFRGPDADDLHFVFELTPHTAYFVDGQAADRSSAMAVLDETSHGLFTVVVTQPGHAAEFHISRRDPHS